MSSVKSEYFGGRLVIHTRTRSLWTDRMMNVVHLYWKKKRYFPDHKEWASATALWSFFNTTGFEVLIPEGEENPALTDALAFWDWINTDIVTSRRQDGVILAITQDEAKLDEWYQRMCLDLSTHVQDVWWTAFEKAQAGYAAKKDSVHPSKLTKAEKEDPNSDRHDSTSAPTQGKERVPSRKKKLVI